MDEQPSFFVTVTERKWHHGVSMLANVGIRLLASILLATAVHFNGETTLFGLRMINCSLYCLDCILAIVITSVNNDCVSFK